MEMPTVCNVLHDSTKNIRYELMAYRELSKDELLRHVLYFVAHAKKKLKKNTCVRIITVIGRND